MRNLSDAEIRAMMPGMPYDDEPSLFGQRLTDQLLFDLLWSAVREDVFPYAVTVWKARMDGPLSVCILVSMGDGVQVAAPVRPVGDYTSGGDAEGVTGARRALDMAWETITCAVEAYQRKGN